MPTASHRPALRPPFRGGLRSSGRDGTPCRPGRAQRGGAWEVCTSPSLTLARRTARSAVPTRRRSLISQPLKRTSKNSNSESSWAQLQLCEAQPKDPVESQATSQVIPRDPSTAFWRKAAQNSAQGTRHLNSSFLQQIRLTIGFHNEKLHPFPRPIHPSPSPHSQRIVKLYRISLAKPPILNEKPPS